MAMPGATRPALGNNPIAFAAPVAGRPPLVFDMALSAVARGAVMAAARDGHAQIPSHWALDAHGHPTTDPHAALQGAMQPMAGHKGLGLAMVVECLAGALGGGLFQPAVPGSAEGSAANACAFLLVINPALAAPSPQGFDNYMANWITGLLAAQGTQGRYPGLRQHECELQRRAEGIPLSSALINELQALARLSGVALAL
jgi:LDH2 family malate/lactate/ureidoglycolate dehydrogenase